MRFRLLALLCLAALVALEPAGAAGAAGPAPRPWYVLRTPISRVQLTDLPFGFRSQWLQPWRSSLITRSARSLQDALGINFNVAPAQADATARLLSASGVRRARLELAWSGMSFADPGAVSAAARPGWTADLQALRRHHLRPLILLNGNSGLPTPSLSLDLILRDGAPAGARTVSLAPAGAAQVLPGLTGINAGGDAAGVLITRVTPAGEASLSRPLPAALPAGPVAATTLRFAPFAPPRLPAGMPNPRFTPTLAGWLSYVRGVCDFVRRIYGSDHFDVEVWNELSFGSDFLDESRYFDPVPDPGATGDVEAAVLAATVRLLRDPAHHLTGVRVGDGFADQVPWVSGATVPPGTSAIDHHPYAGVLSFPQPGAAANGVMPVDALGRPSYAALGAGVSRRFRDVFSPRYRAFFPEYFLTGIQTETLMRDLSPFTTSIYGTPHGALTHPPGAPAPANWITEDALDAGTARRLGMPAADVPEFQAKAALRFYLAYASTGATAIDLYAAAAGGCCQLISPRFLDEAGGGSFPGLSEGGLPMRSVARMVATLAGARAIRRPRQLTLAAIASDNDADVQFSGDGSSAFPALYNRDVLAFFPFQVSRYRFVSAVYVMSRDLARRYAARPAPGQTPYDLPPEDFRLNIGNVDGAQATVSMTDPLTGRAVPARIVARAARSIVVEVAATDAPRMLTITDRP